MVISASTHSTAELDSPVNLLFFCSVKWMFLLVNNDWKIIQNIYLSCKKAALAMPLFSAVEITWPLPCFGCQNTVHVHYRGSSVPCLSSGQCTLGGRCSFRWAQHLQMPYAAGLRAAMMGCCRKLVPCVLEGPFCTCIHGKKNFRGRQGFAQIDKHRS